MSKYESINDLKRRCAILLNGREIVTFDNVQVEKRGDCLQVMVLGPVSSLHGGDTVRSARLVYDDRAPVYEQLVKEIEELVIPVLQKHMVLDDLADI